MTDYSKHFLAEDEVPEDERLVVNYIPLEEIRKAKRNPNEMTPGEQARLKAGIKMLGFMQPLIVVPTEDGEQAFELVDGHHRFDALVELDYTAAPCIVAESWSAAEQILARIAMNKNRGELNLTAVAEDIAVLHDEFDMDIDALVVSGYDEGEINDMLKAMTNEFEPQPSDIANTPTPNDASDRGAVNPRPFVLEILFPTKEQRKAVRDACKHAGNGDITTGLLVLAGIEEN